MTTRVKGFVVALEQDIREDAAERIVDAIKMIRGVLSVEASVADHTDWMARERARRELGDKLMEVVFPKKDTP